MVKLRWTREAEAWIREIHEHIAPDNPAAAERTVQGIYDRAQVLRDFPEIGYKFHELPERNLRVLLYGHYRIAYLIRDQDTIDIVGVFHGSLDMVRHLK